MRRISIPPCFLPNSRTVSGLVAWTAARWSTERMSGNHRYTANKEVYVSLAQHPRTRRNVCGCELPLSRMRWRHRARNKSARMFEMCQALATGLGTNTSSHSEQGNAIVTDEVIDKRYSGIW